MSTDNEQLSLVCPICYISNRDPERYTVEGLDRHVVDYHGEDLEEDEYEPEDYFDEPEEEEDWFVIESDRLFYSREEDLPD